jgi:spore coat polysaccharide biosynthesis predicted glycosyltransferase SpsG/CMP-N-acetylneuraminic acid synthetase
VIIDDPDPIGIIPARGVSPGLPKKNFKRIGDKPLVAYTVETAVSCEALGHVIVSTESEDLAEIARSYGARVPFLRPEELSRQGVFLDSVVLDTVEKLSETVDDIEVTRQTPIVVLQPNVPFRREKDIHRALAEFETEGTEPVISVVERNRFYWQRGDNDRLKPLFDKRQTLRKNLDGLYRETGSITVTSLENLGNGEWTGDSPRYVLTDRLSSFDINGLVDIWLAEQIASGLTVVLRVDGGGDLGMGKVYRGLTIATALTDMFECDVHFITGQEYHGGIDLIRNQGFDVTEVASNWEEIKTIDRLDPDIVFIDTGETDTEYIQMIHDFSAAVVNVEDIEIGVDYSDFTLNPQRDSQSSESYNNLMGPEYIILREEFLDQPVSVPKRVTNVLITFGGSDPLNLSAQCVRALADHDLPYDYRVVLGPDYDRERLFDICSEVELAGVDLHEDVANMGEFMQWADIALSSGGRTVFELAATGTPAIVIAQNDGEMERMELLSREGAIELLGHGERIDIGQVPDRLELLARNYERRKEMTEKSQKIVDGKGVERILDLVHQMLVG